MATKFDGRLAQIGGWSTFAFFLASGYGLYAWLIAGLMPVSMTAYILTTDARDRKERTEERWNKYYEEA